MKMKMNMKRYFLILSKLSVACILYSPELYANKPATRNKLRTAAAPWETLIKKTHEQGKQFWRAMSFNLFNFHHHLMVNRPKDLVLLSELGNPATLSRKDKPT